MAKLILNDITDAPGFDVTVNDNWRLIEQAIENTYSRDNTVPNFLEGPLDANSFRLNNLADGIDQQDAVTIAQLIQASIAGPVSIGSLIDVDLTGINVDDILQWDGIQFLPVPLILPQQATETIAGIAEIATQAEVDAGVDDLRFVTPAKLSAFPAVNQATETVAGIAELATQGQTNSGSNDTTIVTPLKLANRTATQSRAGVIEIATQGEVDAGVDDTRAVTPAKLAAATTVSGAFRGCVIYRSTFFLAGHTAGNFAGSVPAGSGAGQDVGELAIPFDMEVIDTGAADFGTQYHSTSVNITRITIPAGVSRVRLKGAVVWDQACPFAGFGETCDPNNNGSGLYHLRIRKNGNSFLSLIPGVDYIPWVMDSGNQQEHGQEVSSVVVDVTAGDYFELMVLTQGSDFAFQRVRRGSVFEMEVIG
jgi:hypothetical protein